MRPGWKRLAFREVLAMKCMIRFGGIRSGALGAGAEDLEVSVGSETLTRGWRPWLESALLAASSVLLRAAGLGLGAAFLGAIAARGARTAFAVGAALAGMRMSTVIVRGAAGEGEHGGNGEAHQAGFDIGIHCVLSGLLLCASETNRAPVWMAQSDFADWNW